MDERRVGWVVRYRSACLLDAADQFLRVDPLAGAATPPEYVAPDRATLFTIHAAAESFAAWFGRHPLKGFGAGEAVRATARVVLSLEDAA